MRPSTGRSDGTLFRQTGVHVSTSEYDACESVEGAKMTSFPSDADSQAKEGSKHGLKRGLKAHRPRTLKPRARI